MKSEIAVEQRENDLDDFTSLEDELVEPLSLPSEADDRAVGDPDDVADADEDNEDL